MSNIVIPDGGNIGSTSDTDAITISSTGKVTTADSELNVKTTSHTFTVKGIDSAIADNQSSTDPNITDSDSGQFAVYNASTKLFGITEHGYIVKPNQPSFYIQRFDSVSAGNFLYANAAVSHNIGNHFNATNGYFTAPVSGIYWVCGAVLTNGANARLETSIYKNDSIYVHGNESAGDNSYGGAHCSALIQLSAGDYVRFKLTTGAMYTGHQNNYFSAHLLS